MMAQISDSVLDRKKPCTIAGINGSGLFDPAEHGIRPVMISTACWRGYHCAYEVADEALFLIEVHLGLDETDAAAAARGEGTELFGIVPRRYTEHGYCQDVHTGQVTTSSGVIGLQGGWDSRTYPIHRRILARRPLHPGHVHPHGLSPGVQVPRRPRTGLRCRPVDRRARIAPPRWPSSVRYSRPDR